MADARTEKQKVKEITDKLEEGLKELFNSEKYKSYLSTMSKFHNYSFNNTLLIALQRPDATLVAGYQVILSRLVDTFSSRILYPMLLLSGNHSIAVV